MTEEVGFISSGGGVGGGGGDGGGGAGLLVLVYRYTGGGIVSARHISLLFVRVRSISPLLSRRRERRLNTFLLRSDANCQTSARGPHSRSLPAHSSSFVISSSLPFSSSFFNPLPTSANAVHRFVCQCDRVRRKVRVLFIGAGYHINNQERKKKIKIVVKNSLCESSFSLL